MTNAAVERSDSQRSQGNGTGPRVSFNRDVHVKRIGPRQPSNDYSHHNYPNTQQSVHNSSHSYVPPLRREPATDLTENQIRKEAALVLSRASQVDCHADTNGRTNTNNRTKLERKKDLTPDRFNSLPNRKKNPPAKPLGRSSSDASNKSKGKRPSIFSLFSKKSNNEQINPSHTQDTQWKRVTRSRSDVGSIPRPEPSTVIRKRNNSETEESLVTKRKSVPLSPIIESPSQLSYFESAADEIPSGNIRQPDSDMVPLKPVPFGGENGSPVTEMHSSQQPADRLPLTKGVTVDGIVKHLSKERFSPIPHLQGNAFSYTRPNHAINYNNNHSDDDKKVVYAHLLPDPIRETSPRPSQSQSPRNGLLRSSLSPPKRWHTENDVDETPIVPVIRKIRYSVEPQVDSLSNRRKLLESRITSRKIGSVEQLQSGKATSGYRPESPTRIVDNNRFRSKSMGRDVSPLVYRQAPEDIRYSPPHSAFRSKSYEREPIHADSFDETDGPVDQDYVTHQQSRFVNNSHQSPRHPVIDLGFIDDVVSTDPDDHYFQHQKYQERYRNEFEPNSLESQYNDVIVPPRSVPVTTHREFQYPEQVHTLRREKNAQRSLERGDSGIERDYRKSSGDEFTSTLRRRSSALTLDPKTLTEQFLKRERLHSERLQANRYNLMFRERSIDDGSLFDPRLDKYPVSTMTRTLRRNQSTSPSRHHLDYNGNHIGRSENKLGRGIEKVKQLFTGKKKTAPSPASSVSEGRKEKSKVSADERYDGNEPSAASRESKPFTDIAMRRRLSTPKASPLPKRTSPINVATETHNPLSPLKSKLLRRNKSPAEPSPQKKGLYKSLERLTSPSSAKSSKSNINSHVVNHSHVTNHKEPRALAHRQSSETSPPPMRSPAGKLRFFGDTDLESNPPTFSQATTSLHRKRIPLTSVNAITTTNLQSQTLPRKHGSTLRGNSTERSSQPPQLPPKSTKKSDFKSSAKHLHEISESASDADDFRSYSIKTGRRSSPVHKELIGSTGSLQRHHGVKRNDAEVQRPTHHRSQSSETNRYHERHTQSPGATHYRKPPSGSQHFKSGSGSQTVDRRKTVSRERERMVDSSGTEGDSSQNSQRSVVYLHATTVGDIPQPHVLHTRRAKSREELSSLKSSSILTPSSQTSKGKPQLQPMTRTVSRSLSVLAPWAPKHIHDGYEINYSQQNNKTEQKTQTKQSRPKDYLRSASTMSRPLNNNYSPPSNGHSSFFNGNLSGQFREQDMRRETLSIPRR